MATPDKPFPTKWPFGVLMTAQWVLSFAALIAVWSLDFWWAGARLVHYTAATTFGTALFSWFAHLFGLHKPLQLGQIHFYIPFAITKFVYSTIMFVLYIPSMWFCIYYMFVGFNYTGNTAVVNAFAAVFCALAGGTCGYLALLLYRAAENKPIKLLGMYIEGTTTVKFASTKESTTETAGAPQKV
uniref:MARVEL domain-containing protein n=1 Tax=Plectus sambesii TaxID=2011161 RepID=A0A914VYB9_9BILA